MRSHSFFTFSTRFFFRLVTRESARRVGHALCQHNLLHTSGVHWGVEVSREAVAKLTNGHCHLRVHAVALCRHLVQGTKSAALVGARHNREVHHIGTERNDGGVEVEDTVLVDCAAGGVEDKVHLADGVALLDVDTTPHAEEGRGGARVRVGAQRLALVQRHGAGAGRGAADNTLVGLQVARVLRNSGGRGRGGNAGLLADSQRHAVTGDGGEALQVGVANVADLARQSGVVTSANEGSRARLDTGTLRASLAARVRNGDAAPTAVGIGKASRAAGGVRRACVHEGILGLLNGHNLLGLVGLLCATEGGGHGEGAEVLIDDAVSKGEHTGTVASRHGRVQRGRGGSTSSTHGHGREARLGTHGTRGVTNGADGETSTSAAVHLNPHLKARAVGDVVRDTREGGGCTLGHSSEDCNRVVDLNVPLHNSIVVLDFNTTPDTQVLRGWAGVRWDGGGGDTAALLLAGGKGDTVGGQRRDLDAVAVLAVANVQAGVGIALLLADQEGRTVAGGGCGALPRGGVASVHLGSRAWGSSGSTAAHSLANLQGRGTGGTSGDNAALLRRLVAEVHLDGGGVAGLLALSKGRASTRGTQVAGTAGGIARVASLAHLGAVHGVADEGAGATGETGALRTSAVVLVDNGDGAPTAAGLGHTSSAACLLRTYISHCHGGNRCKNDKMLE